MITFGRRKTRKAKKPTRPRRRALVRRIPRAPSYRGLDQWTPYKFKFTLLPNILGNLLNGGGVEFKSGAPGTAEVGTAPFTVGTLNIGGLVPSATGVGQYIDFGMTCPFRLSDCVNAQNFAISYDAYRIDKVHVTIQYLSNSAQVNGGGLFPTIYVYNDPDDYANPTSLQQITAKQGVRKFFLGNGARTVFTHNVVPRANDLTTAPGANPTGIALAVGRKHKWIDSVGQAATTAVPHNSLKVWVTDWDSAPAPVANILKFQFTYHISFRGPLIAN